MSALVARLLELRPIVWLGAGLIVFGGLVVAPFDWDLDPLPRARVPVDAIPDIGENQQIVYTAWPGHSPSDVEDQITTPLVAELLGTPGVKTVRATSMFGISMVHVVVEDDIDFHWSRARLQETISSLPAGLLPAGLEPALGPDATALGQVFWYTLEGRTPEGEAVGGWSLAELRSIQDYFVKPALSAAKDVAEIASVGGYVREYQIDVDPDALRAFGIPLEEVTRAVAKSNRDVSARTIELNGMELIVRGVGFIEDLEDIEQVAIRAVDGVPIRVADVARVHLGPALRRGALDKAGAEAVGGVAVVRFGANPLACIEALKAKIGEIASSLPKRTLEDGRVSQVTIVPFYDRTELIHETLDTLESALTDQILVTIVVVLIMLLHLRSSLMISLTLPLGVLLTFVGMKVFGVDANVVALSGIAIAIGTMVDMAIVVMENIVRHIERAPPDEARLETVKRAVREVAGAVTTAVATTVVSFLPVFFLEAAEGKLFGPLAWTKTLALVAALVLSLIVLPALAASAFPRSVGGFFRLRPLPRWGRVAMSVAIALVAAWVLAGTWEPLGRGEAGRNYLFVVLVLGLLLGGLLLFQWVYPRLLGIFLRYKAVFLLVPATLVVLGASAWLGADHTFGWLLGERASAGARAKMPGLEGEFMPRLLEGSFLYMPSTMPHASIGSTLEAMQALDRRVAAIPEVKDAVGKLGRADSALDPAPVTMIETIVTVRPEWTERADGTLVRNWRDHITSLDDVWDEVVAAAQVTGLTSAPPLQPIEGRIVMLQTGMRARMGVKLQGDDLEQLAAAALEVQGALEGVELVQPGSVVADRPVGKPYLEIHIDRDAIDRYGLQVDDVQRVIEVAIGGRPVTTTVEGRERYPVRLRYPPELRDSVEAIGDILVDTPEHARIPLRDLADVRHTSGPQMIRSEDTFKTVYVTFAGKKGVSDSQMIGAADAALAGVSLPEGVKWRFEGSWRAKLRSDRQMMVLVPVAVVLIFMLLYLQFRSTATSLMVLSGVAVAMAGGFLMLWLWGQSGWLDTDLFGHNLRDVFHVPEEGVAMSTAVWVGFIALIGIATDDGVVMATYLDQRFEERPPRTREEVAEAVMDAGRRRIRPCLMTTATTVLALLPVLSNDGRGAEIMVPMAIPAFGGMALELVTLFVVPVLYCGWKQSLLVETPPTTGETQEEEREASDDDADGGAGRPDDDPGLRRQAEPGEAEGGAGEGRGGDAEG